MDPFSYQRVSSPEQAVAALVEGGAGTRLLAGGTTLFDLMKLDIERPTRIVDINGIAELSRIDTRGHELVFGALARMSDVARNPVLVKSYPALSESLWKAASQQIRNRATVGGNLLQRTRCAYFRGGEPFPCNKRVPGSGCAAAEGIDRGHALLGVSASCIATYPGDWAVALMAFDAQVDVLGPKGARAIPIGQLHVEPGEHPEQETVLEPNEIIVRIRVPATPLGRASTFHKVRDRESYAFALASAAVALQMDGDVVLEARIALGGVATRPWRAQGAELKLKGLPLDAKSATAAGKNAYRDAHVGHHNAFRVELGVRTVADALMIARNNGAHT